jgi:C4-dicarboxylate-specific signal transduction histidine kinase
MGHLVRNACHAAAGGTIRIGWARRDGDPVMFVEDSGPGIGEETRRRMFDPFFTTKPPGEGSGLGLAIVRGIAADHDAELVVYRSEALGGAGFELRFRSDG